MSASMRDWIGPLVESELNSVLTSFESKYVPGQRAEEGHRICGPDTVTVHVKKGREVQVIEFHERSSYPSEATVSDGTTHIRATFDRVATDLFMEMNSRDFFDIRGGVIALVEFDIFKFRGSEGSKPFGRPSDILKDEGIQSVFGRLEGLLDGDIYASDIRSQPPSPVQSQVNDLPNRGNHSSADDASQTAFATQVPNRVETRPANQVAASFNERNVASFLSLLSKKLVPSNQNDKSTANQISREQALTTVSGSRKKPVLMPVSNERALEMTSKIEAKANEQQSQFPFSSRPQASNLKNSPILIKNQNPVDTSILFSDDSEKENSQQSMKDRRPKMDVQQVKAEQGVTQLSIIDQFQDANPFLGLKRVPRRYVRIPEWQQSLLERKDSWYEPQTNSRSPYAIIPAEVRNDLIGFSARKSLSRKKSQQSGESGVDSDDSDDELQPENERRACKSSVLKRAEKGMNLVEEESSRKEPLRMLLKTLPTAINIARRDDRDQDFATRSNDQQKLIHLSSSIPDGCLEGEEADEVGRSEDGDDIADEDLVSWASSPQQRSREMEHRTKSSSDQISSNENRDGSPNLSGSIQHCLSPLTTLHEPDMHTDAHAASQFSEPAPYLLPQHGNNNGQQNPQSIRNSWTLLSIPSSSPAEEEELELAIPHTIGDLVEEIDSEEDESSSVFQKYPSTALQNPKLVQVEQTPFPPLRRTHGSSFRSKQDDDFISSDPRIPATCDAPNPEESALGFKEKGPPIFKKYSEIKILTTEYRNVEPQHITQIHAQVSLEREDEDDDLVQKQLAIEYESSEFDGIAQSSTRVQTTISLDENESLERLSLENQMSVATPLRSLTTGQNFPEPPSSPLAPPLANQGQFVGSSPASICSLKRDGDSFWENPQNPPKRPRRVPAASMIMEEEYTARDSKEMARTNRHRFNDRLSLAAELNTPIIPSESLPNSPKPKVVIPSTIPAVGSFGCRLSKPPVSSAKDDMQHVPATFEELTPIPRPVTLQDTCTPAQSIEIICNPNAASRIQDTEANASPDVEEDDAVFRGSLLPFVEPEAHSQLDFYDEFLCVYPDYLGSKKAFTWALVYIEWLRERKQFLHRALCDDFVRVLSSDFKKYAEQSESFAVEDKMNGWEFFHSKNQKPVFKYEVITPENLQDAIASLNAEQVARYRKKFAEPDKAGDQPKSVLQQSVKVDSPTEFLSKLKRSEDALAANDSVADHFSEERASPTSSRDMRHELASVANAKVFAHVPSIKPSLLSTSREVSPELEFLNGSYINSNHPTPRKPYFETYSQLPTAQQQARTIQSRPSAAVDLNPSRHKTKSGWGLPWAEEGSPGSSIIPLPGLEGKSSTVSVQRDLCGLPLAEQRKTSSSKARSRTSPPSPILGSPNKFARPIQLARANTSRPPLDRPDVVKLLSSSASKVSSFSRTNLPKETIDDPEKVERWRTEVLTAIKRKPSFKEWADHNKDQIQRKRSARALSSKVSTPNSTPNKRFCTKPAKVTPERFELETQGWGDRD